MTKTEIIERYSKELEYIKNVMNLSTRELYIYIAAYADGNNCTLEQMRCEKDES